jgi:recombination protein RecR
MEVVPVVHPVALHELELLLADGKVREVILATNSTVEGEATAHVVSEMARALGLAATRIAQGVPFGGELEYVDGGTLAHALAGRQNVG